MLATTPTAWQLLEETTADSEFQQTLVPNGIVEPLATITYCLTTPTYSVQQPDFFPVSLGNLIPYILTSHCYGSLDPLLRGSGLLQIFSAVADQQAFVQYDSWRDLLKRLKIVLLLIQDSFGYSFTLSQIEMQLGGATQDFLGNSSLSDAWKILLDPRARDPLHLTGSEFATESTEFQASEKGEGIRWFELQRIASVKFGKLLFEVVWMPILGKIDPILQRLHTRFTRFRAEIKGCDPEYQTHHHQSAIIRPGDPQRPDFRQFN
ncbi:hypothetical protein B0H16DRAFT_1456041 [Mycena metata]|uniref:Uncharacterized protein n=1 Tax=Mycena metata TaxID=1033252 RepID=A0AAD7JBF6_9AGAR|nr:hypothetical protein B0H16DRAFT_1456041 [Mycena metata]